MNSSLRYLRLLLAMAHVALIASFVPSMSSASVEALLKPADVRSVVVSPDGAHLAMVRSDESKDTLVIFKRPSMAVATGVSSRPGQRFATITWANSARVLIEPAADQGTMAGLRPTGALLGISIDGAKSALLPAQSGVSTLATAIVNVLPDDPQHVLVAARGICEPEVCTDTEADQRRLIKLNVDTGQRSTLGDALDIDPYYVSDPTGKQVLAAGRTADAKVEVYRLAGGIWTQVTTFDPAGDLGTVPFAIDASGRVFALANKVGTAALYEWDLASGETKEIYRGAKSDIDTRVMSYGGRELLAVRSDPGFPSWHYLKPDGAFAGTHKSLRAAYPESDVDVTSFTADGVEAVVRVHSDRNSGDFYIVNTSTRDTSLLATSRPGLSADSLAAVEPFEFTTRDMFTLRGYVSTPAGEGPHPMVVMIHDEPYSSRATWEFNPEVQMFAEHGFAVLQVNYRGSAGLGQYYSSSGAERDGRAVQRDIADATKWAIEQNIATRDQICVYGRGYGGFAAVKALASNIGMFSCAVGVDGVYDLSQPVSVPENPQLTPQSLLNVPSLLDMADANRSPLARLGNIGVPVMLLGESAQTTAMRDALQAADKSVEWLPGDDEAGDYAAILAYLGSKLGGAAAPAPTDAKPSFGTSLSTRQAREFQKVVDAMGDDVKEISTKVASPAALTRSIRRIVNRYDDDVRALVSEEQWALYDDFKPGLVQRLEGRIDTMRIQ